MENVGKESIKSGKNKTFKSMDSEVIYESLSLPNMPWIHARKQASYHS